MFRKTSTALIAQKLIAVQPMLEPTGLVYYMRFRYSETKKYVKEIVNWKKEGF